MNHEQASSHVEQHQRDQAAIAALAAERDHLKARLVLAERVATLMADREAKSRLWAERCEAQLTGGGFEGVHTDLPAQRDEGHDHHDGWAATG